MEKYLITEFETYGREPILYKMEDESLFCTFLTGDKREPGNENVAEISKSFDGGKTWTKRETLFSHLSRGVWCTDIFGGGKYPMLITHLYHAGSHYRELQTLYSITKDSGKTWTEPTSVPGSVNGCSLRQGFVLSNGDYIFPLYWQEILGDFDYNQDEYKGSDKWTFRGGVGISHDKGATWHRYGYFAKDYALWEPNAVEVEPGHVILYFRNPTGYLMMSESFDYGKTWAELVKSEIPNPDTKFILKKINNKIIMINNMAEKAIGFPGRVKLSILISDNGKDFEKVIALSGSDEPFFYPHAYADDEERILYVAYENAKEHYLVKIGYDELGL